MPNWKKLVVSGSDATLKSLYVNTSVTASVFSGSFTGSLFGTASWARNSLTASYVVNAVSASYAASSSNILGGTANYLPIWTNSTTLSSSAVYQTGGNVGIGTTSPGEKLSVSGSIVVNTGNSLKFGDPTSGVNTFGVSHVNNTGLYLSVYKAGGGGILGTNSADAVVIIQDTGNVGIGTTSPSTRLHTAGSTQSTAAAEVARLGFADSSSVALFTNGDPLYGTLFGSLSSGKGWIQQQRVDGSATAYDLSLQPNGGNVGINTTSPGTYKLTVNGSTHIGDAFDGTEYGKLQITRPTNPSDTAFNMSFIREGSTVSGFTYVTGSNKFGFWSNASNNSTTPTMVWNSSTVGINTSNPNQALEVAGGNGSIQLRLSYDGDTRRYNDIQNQWDGGTLALNQMTFKVATTSVNTTVDVMTLVGNGNVGIADYSPSARLSIKEANTGVPGIKITNWNSTNTVAIGSDSSTGGGKVLLSNNAGTQNVFISSYGASYFNGGVVGINTTSPNSNLDVNGTTVSKFFGGSGSTTNYAQFEALMSGIDPVYGNNYSYFGLHRSGFVSWQLGMISSSFVIARGGGASQYTLWTDRPFAIDGSNNVGIGTITPEERLHVVGGNIKVNNAYAMYFGDSANNNGGRIYCPSTSNDFYINQANNSPLYLATNNTIRATITGGGNIGIGFTSPSEKLEVSGSIKTLAPSGYTAKPWKLGDVSTGTCVPSDFTQFSSWFTGTVISIEVDGTTYFIPAVTPNYC